MLFWAAPLVLVHVCADQLMCGAAVKYCPCARCLCTRLHVRVSINRCSTYRCMYLNFKKRRRNTYTQCRSRPRGLGPQRLPTYDDGEQYHRESAVRGALAMQQLRMQLSGQESQAPAGGGGGIPPGGTGGGGGICKSVQEGRTVRENTDVVVCTPRMLLLPVQLLAPQEKWAAHCIWGLASMRALLVRTDIIPGGRGGRPPGGIMPADGHDTAWGQRAGWVV